MNRTLFGRMTAGLLIFGAAACIAGFVAAEFLFSGYYYDQQREVLLSRTAEAAAQIDAGGDASVVIDSFDSEYGVSLHYAHEKKGIYSGQNTHGMMGRQSVYSEMTQERVGTFFETGSGKGGERRWLSYLTQTGDGALLLGRVSYAAMDAVIDTAKAFFLAAGIAAAAAFAAFAFFFARSVSRPLRRLSELAAKMTRMDFSARYDGRREDEIGRLGAALNQLMTRLESADGQFRGARGTDEEHR